jgi:hypothetical protein
MLNALDTNPVPAGRDIYETPELKKREKWARSLHQARRKDEQRKTVKLVSRLS